MWVFLGVLILIGVQLVIGTYGGLSQFAGKGFGYRLIGYPILLAIAPVAWWLRHRDLPKPQWPWAAFTLIALPFLIDVTGNSANLFDTIDIWDNINHYTNWAFLLGGIGLLVARADVRPRWLLILVITGTGAAIAILWEVAEWYTFIRRGTELNGAYEDTLSDEVLGTLGSLTAALIVWRLTRRAEEPEPSRS